MIVDVALNPAEIALLPQRDLSCTVCIVFDVLRATSSMITALAHGAEEILPVRTIEEAREVRVRDVSVILGGERHGDPIEGFDVGNNPLDYTQYAGRRIVTTTTNGTIALRNCEHAASVVVGALLNIEALRQHIVRESSEHLLLVCAGTFETFALEDAYAAGLLISQLPDAELTDAACSVAALTHRFKNSLDALLAARNGKALAERGWRDQVEYCAEVSRFHTIGTMTGGIIRRIAS